MQKILTLAESSTLKEKAIKSAKEAGDKLCKSPNTINNHLKSLKEKVKLFKDVEIAFLVCAALCNERYEDVKARLDDISAEELRVLINKATKTVIAIGFISLSLHIQIKENHNDDFTKGKGQKIIRMFNAKRGKETI